VVGCLFVRCPSGWKGVENATGNYGFEFGESIWVLGALHWVTSL
jgi:hypothetical protein